MELSIFLAKLIGLYFLAVALIALFRKDQFLKTIKSMTASAGLIALAGVLSLIAGLAILIGHPIWEWSWRGVVSFIGALSVLQGVLRLGFTDELQKAFPPAKLEKIYWAIIPISLLLGVYLTYSGFYPG